MADRVKGITIEINGDTTGLSKSLQGVNSHIRTTAAQLKDVEKLLKLDPTNTDLLAQKQRLLGEQIGNTEKKLAALKEAEKQVQQQVKQGKASQEQYEALQREIASTEADLKKLNTQLSDSNKTSKDAAKGQEDLGDKTKKSGDAAGDASAAFEKLGSAAKAAAAVSAAAFAAATAAVIGATKALTNMTVQGAEYADTVLTESTVTGIATDKLQGYMYAAELVDVSTETLTKSMAKNIKSMKSAADGSKTTADAYKTLGIQVQNADGSLRDGETVYWEIIQALGKMDNETERDALAMQLLGKSAQELNPLIEAGAERMKELCDQAEAAGYVLSDDMLNAYGAFDDHLRELESGATAAKNALGTVLLPILTDLAGEGVDLLGEFTNAVLNCNGDISQLGSVIDEMAPQVLEAVEKYLPSVVEVAGSIISVAANAIVDASPEIVSSAGKIVESLLGTVSDALPSIARSAAGVIETFARAILQNLGKILSTAEELVLSLLRGIENKIPEVVGAVKQIISTVTSVVNDFARKLGDEILPSLIPTVIGGILEIIMAALDELPEAISAGYTLIDGLLEGILNGVGKIISMLPELVGTIFDALLSETANEISGLGSILDTVLSMVGGLIEDIVSMVPQLISRLVSSLLDSGTINKLSKSVGQLIQKVLKGLASFTASLTKAVVELLKQVLNVKTLIKTVWEIVKAVVSGIWESIIGLLDGLFSGDSAKVSVEPTVEVEPEVEIVKPDIETGDILNQTQEYIDALNLQDMFDRLSVIVQPGGFISAEDLTEAQYILDQINGALGTSYTITDNMLENYEQTTAEMQTQLELLKQQALTEALKNQYAQSFDRIRTAQEEVDLAQQAYDLAVERGDIEAGTDSQEWANLEAAKETLAYWQTMQDEAFQYMGLVNQGYGELVEEILNGNEAAIEAGNALNAYFSGDLMNALPQLTGFVNEYKDKYSELPPETQAIFDQIYPIYEEAAAKFVETTQGAVDDVEGLAPDAEDSGEEVGKSVAWGIRNGIEAEGGSVADAGRAAMHGAIQAIRTVAEIHSPSQVMFEIGDYMMQGLADGIDNGTSEVVKAAQSAMRQAINAMKDTAEIASPSKITTEFGAFIDKGLAKGITDNAGLVETASSAMMSMSALNPIMQQASNTNTTNNSNAYTVSIHIDAGNVSDPDALADLVIERFTNGVNSARGAY